MQKNQLKASLQLKDEIRVRKDTEKRLSMLSSAIEQCPTSVMITDTNGTIQYVNPKLTEITGYTFDEAIGKNIKHSNSGLCKPELYKNIWDAITSGKTWCGELCNKKKNGETYWEWVSISPIVDHNEKMRNIIFIASDITEKNKLSAELEWTLKIQRQISKIQELTIGHESLKKKLKVITDGVIECFGADFCRIWLVRPGDICSSGCFYAQRSESHKQCQLKERCLHLVASSGRYNHIDSKTRKRIPLGASTIGGIATSRERKLLTNDVLRDPIILNHNWAKELGLVSFAGYKLTINRSEPIGVLALFSKRPISTKVDALLESLSNSTSQMIQKAFAEETLRESEEKFRTITDSAYDGIVMIDANGRISFWNTAAVKIFGYTVEEVIGKDLHLLLSPKRFHKAYLEGFNKFKKTGQGNAVGRTLELTGIRKCGEEIPIELSIASVKIMGQWNAIGVIRDIRDRKQTEETLRKAKEIAEAASSAKSEFLANMSHEIRTPLNGIIGLTELSLAAAETLEQKEHFLTINYLADSLLLLLNDILDFSKIEAGKLDIASNNFNLRETIDNIMESLALKAQEKGLELLCSICPDVPEALIGDPDRLRQIIVNIVGNAIKFTEHGEIVLHIETLEKQHHDNILHFAVCDTGIGIPEDKQQFIFKSFTQADNSTTRKFGGTGLGLAISKRLLEIMGGRIWVESNKESGSTFHFTVPFRLQDSDTEFVLPDTASCLKDIPVLIVDNNSSSRRILSEMLCNFQMDVNEATGFEETLEKVHLSYKKKKPFQLVILNSAMPGVDDFKLLNMSEMNSSSPEIKVIMLTSVCQRTIQSQYKKKIISAYIQKPMKQSKLLDTILEVLWSDINNKNHTPVEQSHLLKKNQRSLKILLAEDNLVNQKLAMRILDKLGHQVVVVNNGSDAVASFKKQPFDLILMDVQMPEMDGFEATTAIRKIEAKTGMHIPIIAMTAHALKGDRERCLNAGMDDYLSKPIKSIKLFQTISSAMALTQSNATVF